MGPNVECIYSYNYHISSWLTDCFVTIQWNTFSCNWFWLKICHTYKYGHSCSFLVTIYMEYLIASCNFHFMVFLKLKYICRQHLVLFTSGLLFDPFMVSISFLNFSCYSCIIFMISFSYLFVFSCILLSFLKIIILDSLSGKSSIFISLGTVTRAF